MFKAIIWLKNLTSEKNNSQLEVVYGGTPMKVEFAWRNPSTKPAINELRKIWGSNLPTDYLKFLGEVTDGATLYYDSKYGQSGFKIFSAGEISEKQTEWIEYYSGRRQSNFIVFAECIGDQNILLFDKLRPSTDGTSFAIFEANLLDEVEDWAKLSGSFHEWLDHLIQAQGDLYWHWH